MNDFLKKFGFTEEEITDFWANGQIIVHRKKDLLLDVNQVNRYLYMLTKGIVRAYVTDNNGKQYTKTFFYGVKKDLALSYRSFTLQEPTDIILEAITDCEAWAWSYDYVNDKLTKDIRYLRYFKHCTDSLYFRFEKRETRMLRSTPEERYQFFVEENPDLIHTIPLQHIATFLGITPETLSRIRKRLGN